MPLFEAIVTKISRGLDLISGIVLAATALLVVANIMGRVILQRPILGIYEMVGFLTAAVVGFALARCALENSHIAIDFILERFPPRFQRAVELIIGIPVLVFLGFTSYNLLAYGSRIALSGQVSPTTQLIFHPFIYIVAFGFFVLSLTVLLKIAGLLPGGANK